jgi:superoxide dismutase, Fe-Mn family
MHYVEKTFNLPALQGMSEKQIEAHLGLYKGYVAHVNLIREKIHEFESEDKEKHSYVIAELRRRFSFEFDGMRMHEYYFESLEGEPTPVNSDSLLASTLSEKYGDWNSFIEHFSAVGMSRGVGWTSLYWDPRANTPHVAWISDHELGVLAGLSILHVMDMWEHAFMVDYLPSEKKKYIEAFLANTNWGVVEGRLDK